MMLGIQRILCAVELALDDVNVLACACVMARPFRAQVSSFLVREGHASPVGTSTRPRATGLDAEREAELLFAELSSAAPRERVTGREEPRGILERSKECDSDLIVLGARKAASPFQRPAGLADELVRRANCPVVTVPRLEAPASVTRILLPVDFSPGTARTVEWACMLARGFSASVHLLHAVGSSALRGAPVRRGVSIPNDFGLAAAKLAEIERQFCAVGVSCASTIAEQGTLPAILACRERESSDFIVMGVHHHRDQRAAATGIASAIRRRVPVPVFSIAAPAAEASIALENPSLASAPAQAASC